MKMTLEQREAFRARKLREYHAIRAVKSRRLLEKRVNKALRAIGSCGSLARYDPTETQANEIVAALRSAIRELEASLIAQSI